MQTDFLQEGYLLLDAHLVARLETFLLFFSLAPVRLVPLQLAKMKVIKVVRERCERKKTESIGGGNRKRIVMRDKKKKNCEPYHFPSSCDLLSSLLIMRITHLIRIDMGIAIANPYRMLLFPPVICFTLYCCFSLI